MGLALDPDVERLLAALAQRPAPPLDQATPLDARAAYRQSCAALALVPGAQVATEDRRTPDGLAVRIYRPATDEALAPCLLYLHGGGWVIGDLETHDGICRTLALESGCAVMAVAYPLAPEHPFPAAIDSVAETLAWLRRDATSLGLDARRLAVGGDSAGANLATVACLLLRDAAEPLPVMQVLFYPATDLRTQSESYARITDRVPLTAARSRWFVRHYLQDLALADDWRASPLLAPDLTGLPPAYLLTVGHDPLRDEGFAYAHRLEASGVAVTHLHLSDQIHGLLTLGRALPQSAPALSHAAATLARATGASRAAGSVA